MRQERMAKRCGGRRLPITAVSRRFRCRAKHIKGAIGIDMMRRPSGHGLRAARITKDH